MTNIREVELLNDRPWIYSKIVLLPNAQFPFFSGAEITEKDLEDLFAKYGECAETFINKEKNFGFIKLDYHCNAEKAKKELDGTVLKSRNLKIRFAPNSASIKIKNLTQFVSNELLLYAFSIFGEVSILTPMNQIKWSKYIYFFNRLDWKSHSMRRRTRQTDWWRGNRFFQKRISAGCDKKVRRQLFLSHYVSASMHRRTLRSCRQRRWLLRKKY